MGKPASIPFCFGCVVQLGQVDGYVAELAVVVV
jgi:hypothetical protein